MSLRRLAGGGDANWGGSYKTRPEIVCRLDEESRYTLGGNPAERGTRAAPALVRKVLGKHLAVDPARDYADANPAVLGGEDIAPVSGAIHQSRMRHLYRRRIR